MGRHRSYPHALRRVRELVRVLEPEEGHGHLPGRRSETVQTCTQRSLVSWACGAALTDPLVLLPKATGS